MEQGLDLCRARKLADIACEEDIEQWLHVAKWIGVGELGRAIKMVDSSKIVAFALLKKYRQAIQAARELVPGLEPIGFALAVDGIAEEGAAVDTETTESASQPEAAATKSGTQPRTLKLAVALRAVLAPPPPPRFLTVHADLPAAAHWFLENVEPEPQRGFGKVKERRFPLPEPGMPPPYAASPRPPPPRASQRGRGSALERQDALPLLSSQAGSRRTHHHGRNPPRWRGPRGALALPGASGGGFLMSPSQRPQGALQGALPPPSLNLHPKVAMVPQLLVVAGTPSRRSTTGFG